MFRITNLATGEEFKSTNIQQVQGRFWEWKTAGHEVRCEVKAYGKTATKGHWSEIDEVRLNQFADMITEFQ